MTRIFRVALILAMTFCSANVFAACAQQDLTGTWFFNGVSGDSLNRELVETDACKLKFGSAGGVISSSSSCTFRTSEGKSTFNVTGGRFTLNEFCAITGNFRYCSGGFCTRLLIDSARMDKQKTVITLVGRLEVDQDLIASFTGVKK